MADPPMPEAPRRLPRQPRARATVDAILEATATLLVERGYEGVNTNAVAERAGVRPPAVYRYFRDKFALYHALAEKLQGELDEALDAALADADARPLPEVVDAVVGALAAFWARRPAFGALWHGEWALRGTVPPAVTFGRRTVARLAAATARFRHLGPEREEVVLAAAMNIGMAVVNIVGAAAPAQVPMVVAEARRAVLAYLEAVLKG